MVLGVQGHQIRALFLKNLSLQSRQKCSTCCQIVFPIICVLIPGLIYQLILKISASSFNGNDYISGNYLWFPSDEMSWYYCPVKYTSSYFCGPYYWGYLTSLSSEADYKDIGNLTKNGSISSGLLGWIPQNPMKTPLDSQIYVPFFIQEPDSSTIDNLIYNNEISVSSQNYNSSYNLPTYALLFQKLDLKSLSLHAIIQSILDSFDTMNYNYPNSVNQFPERRLSVIMSQLTSALISNYTYSNVSLNIGLRTTQYNQGQSFSLMGFGAFFTIWFLPIALTFLLPVYIFTLVMEKKERLLEMMKIMGLSMKSYWLVNYLFFYILYLGAIIILSSIGAALSLPSFVNVPPLSYIILFLLWGNAQIASAYFLSTFFQSQRAATIFSYILVFLTGSAGISLNIFYFQNNTAPLWFMWWPPFAFIRGVFIICSSLFGYPYAPLTFDSIFHSELGQVYVYLIVETFIYLILAGYLFNVIPREHGVTYSPLFPIEGLLKFLFKKTENFFSKDGYIELTEGEVEDPDCLEERRHAHHPEKPYLLRIVDLHKRFQGKTGETKVALVNLCLTVEKGECLGLLGPNGAGKSTTAHILCGLIHATSGHALVDGLDTQHDMYKIHQILGFCPQHDILWADLTITEHLLFYIRLKGNTPKSQEFHEASDAAFRVGLGNNLDTKVSQLSGGMKRRLSLAIALVGKPKLILLDEPTSGLDPETRRAIWDIINLQRQDKSLILTTHNMEEADVLCSRIAILSKGKLLCIGTQLHLKNKFGKGYSLSITVQQGKEIEATNFIKSFCPTAELASSFSGIMAFQIDKDKVNLSELIYSMKTNKSNYGIIEWGINQTSLEEVFLRLIKEDESTD